MKAQIKRQLEAADWDFVTNPEIDASSSHWYPGTFVPALPGTLIEALSSPGSIVMDPFGGVGTTALAAILRGRRAISVDINPIGVLAALSSTALLTLRLSNPQLFMAVIHEMALIISSSDAQSSLPFGSSVKLRNLDRTFRTIVNCDQAFLRALVSSHPSRTCLEPWYARSTLRSILALRKRFTEQPSILIAALGLNMISSIARQLSSQTKSWGHVADKVLPKELIEKDTKRAALDWLGRTANRVERSLRLSAPGSMEIQHPACYLYCHDWLSRRNLRISSRPTLLVTSPPYAGAIDYALAQRLSLHLIGYSEDDIAKLCSSESGARRKRFNKQHIGDWSAELCRSVEYQVEMLEAAAFAAFVMPHKDHGRDIGEIQLKETMANLGWSLEFEKHRSIRQVRARHSWTSIKRETILIFEQK